MSEIKIVLKLFENWRESAPEFSIYKIHINVVCTQPWLVIVSRPRRHARALLTTEKALRRFFGFRHLSYSPCQTSGSFNRRTRQATRRRAQAAHGVFFICFRFFFVSIFLQVSPLVFFLAFALNTSLARNRKWAGKQKRKRERERESEARASLQFELFLWRVSFRYLMRFLHFRLFFCIFLFLGNAEQLILHLLAWP